MTWTATRVSVGTGSGLAASLPPPAEMFEKALTLAAMGVHEAAMRSLRDVTARAPGHGPAWRKLAELMRLAGMDEEAEAASRRAAAAGAAWSPVADGRSLAEVEAAEDLLRKSMDEIFAPPEQIKALRERLKQSATDAVAMRLLGRLEWAEGDPNVARALFERALSLAPIYEGARADLAGALRALNEVTRAASETARLVADAPTNVTWRALHADSLRGVGDLAGAIAIMEQLLAEQPRNERFRCGYAQALHFAGRREDSRREYRECLALRPDMGDAYWGLAELRAGCLDADDAMAMRRLLREGDQDPANLMPMQNALGQTLERLSDFAGSFAAYEAAAALAREIAADAGEVFDPIDLANRVRRRRTVFSAKALAASAPRPLQSRGTPIFVVGMPRAGSTLVEQILGSHSRVEATLELPLLANITRELSRSRIIVSPDAYPECLGRLTEAELAELGARYLDEAAAYRKTDRPFFIDKRPGNWLDAGLIRMILPHAKIIDVRRESMAACFAMYKQLLADDAEFTHKPVDLAQYYTQYTSLMDHYDVVMPGQVHLLRYERLVEDTDLEIRRLLDHCDLQFEEACARFWESDRAVATPSAEQVRRPIFRDALEGWRNFEPWLGPLQQALRTAEAAAAAAPPPLGYERALTLAAMAMHEAAIEQMREVTGRAPNHPGAWRRLAEWLRLAGRDAEADAASAAAERCAAEASKWRNARDPRTPAQLEAAERTFAEDHAGVDRNGQANLLRRRLLERPIDAASAHLLSRLEWQDGDEATSLSLLERTLELSPSFHFARAQLAVTLFNRGFFVRALEQTTTLVRQAPRNPDYRGIHSDALKSVGDVSGALSVTEGLLREQPREARFWCGYGQLLQTVGRRDDAARAFRTSLEISPDLGEAHLGLADLKKESLTEADVGAMRDRLADRDLAPNSRMYICYALAHALERTGDFAASFAAYEEGARLFHAFFASRGEGHDEATFVDRLRRRKRVFSSEFLARGPAPDSESAHVVTPIFVVGMPRAGSTLVEQILASHSQVEGTRELPLIGDIVRDLTLSRRMVTPDAYPECLTDMTPERLRTLGARYLDEARAYRKTDRLYFVDKRPWNWMEAGLIRLILPHAKIVDVRREPMAACFAMFKQVLVDGADVTYDLHGLGRYYAEYVSLMDHYRTAMPGRIHFLQYERLVEHTETEVRQLLDHCGLPFEPACLRFWETERAISTPSAEQVRGPIFRDAMAQWRNYEPWLESLKAALAEPPRS